MNLKQHVAKHLAWNEREIINEGEEMVVRRVWGLRSAITRAHRDRDVRASNKDITQAFLSALYYAHDEKVVASFATDRDIYRYTPRNNVHRAIRRFLHWNFWNTKVRGWHYDEDGLRHRFALPPETRAFLYTSREKQYGWNRVRRFWGQLLDHWFGYPRKGRLKPTGWGESNEEE